ncbi:MAG: porin family protein [Gammaproteobacteria bacterium]|nr:porin family protein [Gammaproteobacteria bacterium]
MKKNLAWGLLLVFLATFSAQSQAEGGWFLGGGVDFVGFKDDLKDIDDGVGFTFSGGYRFNDNWSAELLAGGSYHDADDLDDDTLQTHIMGGAKYSIGGDSFKPYGVVGFSWNRLAFGDVEDVDEIDDLRDFDTISGLGLYAGIGADIFVARAHAINVGFRTNRWNGDNDNTDYDVREDMFSVAYNFHFNR